MGFFYSNITLQTINQQDVALYLNGLQRNSFVLPAHKGFVTVCDEDSDTFNTQAIESLSGQLSEHFACLAIAVVNFDDDVLWYQVYQDGNLLDQYNSNPDYFETGAHGGPTGGDANLLCKILDKPKGVGKVEKILLAPHGGGYILENDRHSDLAKALGWAGPYLFLNYRELVNGGLDEGEPSSFAKPLTKRALKLFIETDSNPSPQNLDKEILKLLRKKKKISAILLYQQHKLCPLGEAKSYVDELEKRG